MLFRHDVVLENGGKAACEHYLVEARGVHTFEKTTFCMKNEDILNNEHIQNTIMEDMRQNVDLPTEFSQECFLSCAVMTPKK